jgi:D-alanine-D-alanine ligase
MKLNIGVLLGGKSTEHKISLLSGKNVVNAIDRSKYDITVIYIDPNGRWFYAGDQVALNNEDDARLVSFAGSTTPVIFSQNADDHSLMEYATAKVICKLDVLYPVLHGNFGEDGSVQGLARLANIPIVGCGILGSAVGMDKDMTKRILRDENIPVAASITAKKGINHDISYHEIAKKLGHEVFIKPVTLGSSVGVSYVTNEEEYIKAMELAFSLDNKVLIEKKIIGREIECAVKGNIYPQASAIGEVIPKDTWYSFESKYIDPNGAVCAIPADLTFEEVEYAQKIAVATYSALECRGLTRVDMFLSPQGEIFVNEVNTLPGFTKISMYPKLWEESGVAYQDLVTELINFALEEHIRVNEADKV